MPRTLKELAAAIMLNDFSNDEWLKIEQEVDEAMVYSTEEECQDFVDSGAGEILDMICSGIREEEKQD